MYRIIDRVDDYLIILFGEDIETGEQLEISQWETKEEAEDAIKCLSQLDPSSLNQKIKPKFEIVNFPDA